MHLEERLREIVQFEELSLVWRGRPPLVVIRYSIEHHEYAVIQKVLSRSRFLPKEVVLVTLPKGCQVGDIV